jgi:hypothetical protein
LQIRDDDEGMSNKLQIAFPATAAFHAAAAKSYAADPKGTAALMDACKASALERSLREDGSFEHFVFVLTEPENRAALVEWLPHDGFIDADRAAACMESVETWRRPSDVGIKATCHKLSVPGVSPEALVADLVGIGEIAENYAPSPQMRM